MDLSTCVSGVEMLEHVISRTPPSRLALEDLSSCNQAVMELCQAAQGYPILGK